MMADAILLIAVVPLMAWLDRQRGTSRDTEVIPKIVALFGMGASTAAQLKTAIINKLGNP